MKTLQSRGAVQLFKAEIGLLLLGVVIFSVGTFLGPFQKEAIAETKIAVEDILHNAMRVPADIERGLKQMAMSNHR